MDDAAQRYRRLAKTEVYLLRRANKCSAIGSVLKGLVGSVEDHLRNLALRVLLILRVQQLRVRPPLRTMGEQEPRVYSPWG